MNNKAIDLNDLNIVINDDCVGDLNDEAIQVLESVVEYFKLDNEVVLFESPHGFIARINKVAGRFNLRSRDTAERLSLDEITWLAKLPNIVRWTEFNHGYYTIALKGS